MHKIAIVRQTSLGNTRLTKTATSSRKIHSYGSLIRSEDTCRTERSAGSTLINRQSGGCVSWGTGRRPWKGGLRNASSARVTPTSGIIPFLLTDVGEGIAECEVLKWHVKEGEHVKEFQKLCELQSDKATVEITSRFTGKIVKLHYRTGQMARVGQPLVDIDLGGPSAAPSSAPAPASSPAPATAPATAAPTRAPAAASAPAAPAAAAASGKVLTSPAVRRLAKEAGLDLSRVRAARPDGRVTKEDVVLHLEGRSAAPAAAPAAGAAAAGAGPGAGAGAFEVVPVRGLMRTMVKTMTASALVPQLGFSEEVRMDALAKLRTELKAEAEAAGVKLTYLPFIIKATSLALRRYPLLNGSLSADQQQVLVRRAHNIGVAMDTPAGLLVPNIKNVQSRSLMDVARELNRLQRAGVEGKLGAADLADGSFSLSNIGSIGGTHARPVLLPPEACIAALGRVRVLPRYAGVAEGSMPPPGAQPEPTRVMSVSWSADHRFVDGATIANFAMLFKKYLEQPGLMLAHLA